MKSLATVLNVIVLCGIVGIGAFQWREAQAQERLQTVSAEERLCLQQNIYFEARNQSRLGQVAVAWVTLNRLESSRYPNTICGVVWQDRQFSWTHDGKPDRPSSNVIEQRAWEDAGLIAEVVLLDWARAEVSPVEAAVMFHADYVQPYWRSAYDRVTQVDDHIFYQ
jgi:spore germination cell wall hydrolase CwlJ-like protein